MKIAGWIFVALAILNVIVFFMAMTSGATDVMASRVGGTVMFGLLSAYFLHRAKQKENDKVDSDNWNSSI